jgi:uncharacterized protein (TIGR03435 family)
MIRSLAFLAVSMAGTLSAQPAAPPRFEVASIKPTPLDQYNGPSGIPTGHGRLRGMRVTLQRCIMGAYGIGPNQISGGPPWLGVDRFEIDAKTSGPLDDDALFMNMLQTLLADRFQLQFHRETRIMEALVLEVAKGGPKLEKAKGPESESSTSSRHGSIDAKATTMAHLAEVLARGMDVPVVDGTGLSGAFDLKLTWSPEADRPVKPGEVTPPDTGPSLFTAVQQQLGLRLQRRKMPIEVFVIDRAEKPSEN